MTNEHDVKPMQQPSTKADIRQNSLFAVLIQEVYMIT